ncbi:tetratricopeptide repeat protein [Thalassobacillus pellis]|uniref:tetratricopeptide repeat protein n=1 Tax=Thalassobacillus pellis TaxID=748008 RepID=UPI00195FD816|nr:tetratricopeptide repeat protein [Thalassobacillus pellis]MBM7551709.1 tetratricopeptide (TPR) repeat protein [Thalassobacillus pellis]
MNIGKRLTYLIETYNKIEPDLNTWPIPEVEWSAVLGKKLPLRHELAAILAEKWNVPIAYLTAYEQNDLTIHRELQQLQHELLTNDERAAQRMRDLDQPMSINSIVQEVIFHLLKAVYHYKENQLAKAAQIEKDYLAIMLPDRRMLKETVAFQRAYFYYFGVKYFFEGNAAESLDYFERLLEKSNDPDEVVSVMQNLALITKNNKDYDQAIHYMKELESFSRKLHHNRGLSVALNYLGVLHLLKGSYPTSIYYFEKLNEMELEPLMQARLYHNLGVLYGKQDRYEDAIAMYHQTIDWQTSRGFDDELFFSYHALARNYFHIGNHDQAARFLNKAKEIAKNEEENMLADMLDADILEEDNIQEAIAIYEKAADYFANLRKLDEIYQKLIKLYEKNGDPNKAGKYEQLQHKLHIKLEKEKEA